MSLMPAVRFHHAVFALSFSAVAFAVTSTIAAAQGTISLSPDWAETPKVYTTTASLMDDSLSLSWDGEKSVLIRLRIVEVINGEGDRFLAGDTLTLEPGSRFVKLSQLLPTLMIGGDLPVVRWAAAPEVIYANSLMAKYWKDRVVESLITEDAPMAWPTEALLVIGFSIEGAVGPEGAEMLPMLVVRPAPLPDGNL